uniref:Uncharacterized protein n=1 Tax=Rhizophora mucronata TaxID=61149 RepID=A0A2P2N836_RHIMU
MLFSASSIKLWLSCQFKLLEMFLHSAIEFLDDMSPPRVTIARGSPSHFSTSSQAKVSIPLGQDLFGEVENAFLQKSSQASLLASG